MTELKTQNKPRIKLVSGLWYAYPGTGQCKKMANKLLYPAISFCKNKNHNRAKTNKAEGVE